MTRGSLVFLLFLTPLGLAAQSFQKVNFNVSYSADIDNNSLSRLYDGMLRGRRIAGNVYRESVTTLLPMIGQKVGHAQGAVSDITFILHAPPLPRLQGVENAKFKWVLIQRQEKGMRWLMAWVSPGLEAASIRGISNSPLIPDPFSPFDKYTFTPALRLAIRAATRR